MANQNISTRNEDALHEEKIVIAACPGGTKFAYLGTHYIRLSNSHSNINHNCVRLLDGRLTFLPYQTLVRAWI